MKRSRCALGSEFQERTSVPGLPDQRVPGRTGGGGESVKRRGENDILTLSAWNVAFPLLTGYGPSHSHAAGGFANHESHTFFISLRSSPRSLITYAHRDFRIAGVTRPAAGCCYLMCE